MADETNPPSPSGPGAGHRNHGYQPSRHEGGRPTKKANKKGKIQLFLLIYINRFQTPIRKHDVDKQRRHRRARRNQLLSTLLRRKSETLTTTKRRSQRQPVPGWGMPHTWRPKVYCNESCNTGAARSYYSYYCVLSRLAYGW